MLTINYAFAYPRTQNQSLLNLLSITTTSCTRQLGHLRQSGTSPLNPKT